MTVVIAYAAQWIVRRFLSLACRRAQPCDARRIRGHADARPPRVKTSAILLLAALAVSAGLAGCGRGARGTGPGAPDTPYVVTKFCGFNLDGRTKEVRMTIDLVAKRTLPPGVLVEVSFDNPLEAGKPIVVARVMKGGEKEVRVVSTPVKGIREQPYDMVVRVYAAADKRALLTTHTESCRAPFSQSDFGSEYR